jgi:hypothetical protein
MASATLEKYLERPRCESCGIGRVRPIHLMRGNMVMFRCSNALCNFMTHAELPEIRKKIIYLDTSLVSHMARAKARGDEASPYYQLYVALRTAVVRNLIVCPGSTIVETEAEMTTIGDTIIEMGRELGDVSLHDELWVKKCQLSRAIERFFAGEDVVLETDLPETEAMQDRPHVWGGSIYVVAHIPTPDEYVEAARRAKDRNLPEVEARYREYAERGLTFAQIADIEKQLFGWELIEQGKLLMQAKQWYLNGVITDVNVMWPSTFEGLIAVIQHRLGCSIEDAARATIDFLASPHVAETPFAYIRGQLQAELAMRCRGNERVNPRTPKPGDQHDIEHMATFMPYVDVFFADQFFASMANQNNLRLGEKFNTTIRSLPPGDIPEFIAWLEELAAESDVAALTERLDAAIVEGGFHEDFGARVRERVPTAFRDEAEPAGEA